ncbi:MarR family winged helix-turn-helix transcriptional regulator [Cesiribacter andamanensis]|uniref:Transcriptional repressor MprA n=1 Tax=Cesiribacter andamanensis AMV16 TaxID=1279009 RepID=M7NGX7_9BACT|nr:MarR family transcriptional regulator [Cesiribacter andamanensis]EMR01095.1 transcriptional repressor MprA [Cesiribacter andamanensis AMV16]
MKIEDEIHQKHFRNEHQKAAVNLIYTHSWLTTRIKQFLSRFDITMQQFNVLRILRGQHPGSISTSVIRDRMLDHNSDASRIVDRLHRQGLVDKEPCPSDRRLVDVRISDKGMKLLTSIDQQHEQIDNFLGKLSEQDAQELNRLLDKIRDLEV